MRSAAGVLVLAAILGGVLSWSARAGDGKSVEERLASLEQRMASVEARVLALGRLPTPTPPLGAGPTAPRATDPEMVTVCVTKTGTKYHRASCSYLRSSSIAMTLAEAKAAGYAPCSRCNPPP